MNDIYVTCGYGERSAKVGVFDILNTLFDSGITVREVSRTLNKIRTTNCIINVVAKDDKTLPSFTYIHDFNEEDTWLEIVRQLEGIGIKLWDI